MDCSSVLAWVLLLWYGVIVLVAFSGFWCILTCFLSPPVPTDVLSGSALEPVTILRPVKGIDPELQSCLELSFLQNYPPYKLQILFCVSDASDPAIPTLRLLAAKYPHIECQILISRPGEDHFGPNPKVNNLAKGFLAAKHDLLWIMDSNVWASEHILKNSVVAMVNNTNCGRYLGASSRKVKLVHHVPLAVALNEAKFGKGSLLDEMFLFTLHLKFYVSLNNLAIAPCVNGKSNMYRKSDLDYAVSRIPFQKSAFFGDPAVVAGARAISSKGLGHSLEFFSRYIGEDNMIGIALWEYCRGRTALTGDLVIQPLMTYDQALSIKEYSNRRVRWLRVRKYMVLAATLVEPTTESLISGLMGTFAVSRLFLTTSFSMWFFGLHMLCWLCLDYIQFYTWISNINSLATCPAWLDNVAPTRRGFWEWLQFWVMREVLALPIWVTAMIGHEINWRGKPFMIKKDLSAEEL